VPAAPPVAITPTTDGSYDEAAPAEQPLDAPVFADDEGPYEPYESPIDISELEKAHDETSDEQPDRQA
jgi:hypothetical protein